MTNLKYELKKLHLESKENDIIVLTIKRDKNGDIYCNVEEALELYDAVKQLIPDYKILCVFEGAELTVQQKDDIIQYLQE